MLFNRDQNLLFERYRYSIVYFKFSCYSVGINMNSIFPLEIRFFYRIYIILWFCGIIPFFCNNGLSDLITILSDFLNLSMPLRILCCKSYVFLLNLVIFNIENKTVSNFDGSLSLFFVKMKLRVVLSKSDMMYIP